jgi:outer membrane protein, multidrug efflux system
MKPYVKIINIAVMLALLPGCAALGIDYHRPDNNLPATYAEADDSTADNAVAESASKWWTLFQDAQLNALVEKAYENNVDIKLAVARIEEADAQMREVGANLLPSVDLGGSAVRKRVTEAGTAPQISINPSSNYKLGLNSSIELDFWGKLRRAKEAARANYLSTQYAKETVLWSLSSLVANNYLMIRSLDSQITVNQENQKISEESLALTKRRQEGGVASALDVYQAELVLADLKSQALELARMRAISEHQLGVLTGELDLKINQAELLAMPTPPTPPAGLPSSLLEARPDVHQAEQAMVAANANIGIAKAALYPSVSLTGEYGGESLELGDILKSAARIWSFGLTLNLPIFNGGKLDSKVDQATAKEKQALASYINSIQTAFREVNDALVNVRLYKAREAIALSKQETAQQMLDVAQNRYKAGYSAYIDVLDAQRTHHEATQSFVQSRQNTLMATVDLFKALGRGWQEPEN